MKVVTYILLLPSRFPEICESSKLSLSIHSHLALNLLNRSTSGPEDDASIVASKAAPASSSITVMSLTLKINSFMLCPRLRAVLSEALVRSIAAADSGVKTSLFRHPVPVGVSHEGPG